MDTETDTGTTSSDSTTSDFSLDSFLTQSIESDAWEVVEPTVIEDGFAYNQIGENSKKIYQQLYTGISQHQEEFYVECESTREIQVAFQALLDDNPEFFYVDGTISIYGSANGGIERVTPQYNIDMSTYETTKSWIDEEVEKVLASIPQNATTYEKVRAVYQYIILNTDYVEGSPQNQNIQSVLIYHQSVCAGYAKAFQYLLRQVGVPCYYVHGTISSTGEAHAWNLVDIDGVYTWVDPTWGDPTYGENATDSQQLDIIYDYLCMTDNEMIRTNHEADDSYVYPEVTENTYDFYRMLNDYFYTFNADEIQNHLLKTVNTGEDITYLKFATFEAYAEAVDNLFNQEELIDVPLQRKMRLEGLDSIQYYYSISDELMTIKIFW